MESLINDNCDTRKKKSLGPLVREKKKRFSWLTLNLVMFYVKLVQQVSPDTF